MTLYFITGSAGKFKEVKDLIPDIEQLDIDLPEIQEVDPHEIIKAKLIEAQKHHEGQFIVEDTSLCFDCLNGLPGPFIKWFWKEIGPEGLYALCDKYTDYGAEAKTLIGYAKGPEDITFFEGSLRGSICSPRGEGFGWDVIFKPEGYEKVFGEMNLEEKQQISMRRHAVEKLKEYFATR